MYGRVPTQGSSPRLDGENDTPEGRLHTPPAHMYAPFASSGLPHIGSQSMVPPHGCDTSTRGYCSQQIAPHACELRGGSRPSQATASCSTVSYACCANTGGACSSSPMYDAPRRAPPTCVSAQSEASRAHMSAHTPHSAGRMPQCCATAHMYAASGLAPIHHVRCPAAPTAPVAPCVLRNVNALPTSDALRSILGDAASGASWRAGGRWSPRLA